MNVAFHTMQEERRRENRLGEKMWKKTLSAEPQRKTKKDRSLRAMGMFADNKTKKGTCKKLLLHSN